MDEVDRIIIHSLNDIGCNVDNEVRSLGDFTTGLIVEAAVRCLEVIVPGLGIPSQLPQNMAAKFHVAASIATACKDLGYRGEVGYQTFLYSNVTEVRRVFMFLIEKLPKESEKTVIEPVDPLIRLKNNIGKVMRDQLSTRLRSSELDNYPFISDKLETGISLPGIRRSQTPQEWRDYCVNRLPFLTDQVENKFILPSIITLNCRGVVEKSEGRSRDITPSIVVPSSVSFTKKKKTKNINHAKQNTWLALRENLLFSSETSQNKENITAIKDKVTDRLVGEEENDVHQKEKQIEQLRSRLQDLQLTVKRVTAEITKVKEAERQESNSLMEKVKENELRHKSLELLANSDKNIKKLEEMIEAGTNRLLALSTQWEKHRKPLIYKYRQVRKNDCEKQMETIRELEEKLDSLNEQIALKNCMKSKLEEEYEKLPKDINRSAYTRRIMEIIGNIKKQSEEINKILRDTKELQKEINSVGGRLERSFTVTDDVIFRNAKKDDASRRSYKLLVTLHADCADHIAMVKETGSISREIRDLEEQIDLESAKNIAANLERITADLEQMKAENLSLRNQLRQIQQQQQPPL